MLYWEWQYAGLKILGFASIRALPEKAADQSKDRPDGERGYGGFVPAQLLPLSVFLLTAKHYRGRSRGVDVLLLGKGSPHLFPSDAATTITVHDAEA